MTTDQIIEELGIEHSSDSFKARIMSNILATADLRFASIIDEVVSETEHQKLQRSGEGKSSEEVDVWLNERYKGASDIYANIVRSIVRDLKNQEAS